MEQGIVLREAPAPLGCCPQIGTFADPTGRYKPMPVFDMPEETPKAWNTKARRLAKGEGKRYGG